MFHIISCFSNGLVAIIEAISDNGLRNRTVAHIFKPCESAPVVPTLHRAHNFLLREAQV